MEERKQVFRGLRTVIYGVTDLARAKDWYSRASGVDPYFDESYYVGFNIGGCELGLDPDAPSTGAGGVTAYWGVANAADALAHMKALGAEVASEVNDVGEGIKVAAILDPFGNRVGIIENPHFDPAATA